MSTLTGEKTYDDFLYTLREHEIETNCKYVMADSRKTFSEKIVLSSDLRLHWNDVHIPYFHFGSRTFHCHQGKDRNVYHQTRNAKKREAQGAADDNLPRRLYKPQLSKKLGCPAKVTVTRMLLLREYKLEHLTAKRKVMASKRIKQKIEENQIVGEERFVFNLPEREEHQFHPFDETRFRDNRIGQLVNERSSTCDTRVSRKGQLVNERSSTCDTRESRNRQLLNERSSTCDTCESRNRQLLNERSSTCDTQVSHKGQIVKECSSTCDTILSVLRHLDEEEVAEASKRLNTLLKDLALKLPLINVLGCDCNV